MTLATFMEVLDTSIANVSLPHIAGSLAASQTEATWVISSYLVANAVILPISGYLATLIGRKRFYMTCVAMFGVSSLLCGLAPSLGMLLFFRVLQGLGGGGLATSEQAILADTFEPKKRGQAFALYGLAVVTAPAIGPLVGGWITDNYEWRWIFFINVPVALVSMYLTNRVVEDPPHLIAAVKRARAGLVKIDYTGFLFTALGFGCLEVVLDKGQEDDWFGSHFITTFTVICIASLAALILWELRQIRKGHKPVIELRLFRSRTFALSFVMMFILGIALYGTTILIPQMLQTLMGYTATNAGKTLSLGGIATLICMPIVGILIAKSRCALSAGLWLRHHIGRALPHDDDPSDDEPELCRVAALLSGDGAGLHVHPDPDAFVCGGADGGEQRRIRADEPGAQYGRVSGHGDRGDAAGAPGAAPPDLSGRAYHRGKLAVSAGDDADEPAPDGGWVIDERSAFRCDVAAVWAAAVAGGHSVLHRYHPLLCHRRVVHGAAAVRDAEVARRSGDALGFAIQADAPVAHVVGFAPGGRSRFVWDAWANSRCFTH